MSELSLAVLMAIDGHMSYVYDPEILFFAWFKEKNHVDTQQVVLSIEDELISIARLRLHRRFIF